MNFGQIFFHNFNPDIQTYLKIRKLKQAFSVKFNKHV